MNEVHPVQLVECPRDAMQGLPQFIPTATKTDYINRLLRVGFHTLDFGSFVSPKHVPQLADTAEVLAGLDRSGSATLLLAIVANERGLQTALSHPEIDCIGYPLSISETFQQRNTNRAIADSLPLVQEAVAACRDLGRSLVVYLSMGFGNPYGDPWSLELLAHWAHRLADLGVGTLALADTVGTAQPADVEAAFRHLVAELPQVTFGAHLHAHPAAWRPKVEAAWRGGCRRFDGALRGFGGCPFAEDELVGNVATEQLVAFLDEQQAVPLTINRSELAEALHTSGLVFA